MPDSALNSCEKIAQTTDVEQTRRSVLPSCFEQNVAGVVLPQDVIDEIGRGGHLASGLLAAGMATFNQTGDYGARTEGALHHQRFRQPCIEVVAEHVFFEEAVDGGATGLEGAADIAARPDRNGVVVGDEAER